MENELIEEWRPIEGYEGRYEVSNTGWVRSLDKGNRKGRILKQSAHKWGYKIVGLSGKPKMRLVTIHRLVAIAFLPNPQKYICVNHIDYNRGNNNVENLEWCSYAQNYKHSADAGRYDKAIQSRSISRKNTKIPQETRKKMSQTHRGANGNIKVLYGDDLLEFETYGQFCEHVGVGFGYVCGMKKRGFYKGKKLVFL